MSGFRADVVVRDASTAPGADANAPITGVSATAGVGTVSVQTQALGIQSLPHRWPSIVVGGGTSDADPIMDGNETGILVRNCAYCFHQGTGMYTASQRAEHRPLLAAWQQEAYPNAVLLWHKLDKGTTAFDPGASNQNKITWDAIFTEGHPEGILRRANGDFLVQEGNNGTMIPVNMAGAVGDYLAQRHVDILHDFGGANSLFSAGVNVHWYSDSMSTLQDDRFGQQLQTGNVTAHFANGELTIPRWTASTVAEDGAYHSVAAAFGGFNPMLFVFKPGFTGSCGGQVTGIKHINGSTSRVQWATANNSYFGAAGDLFSIGNRDRNGYTADWGSVANPEGGADGIDEPRTDPTQAGVRATIILNYFQKIGAAWSATAGHSSLRGHNFVTSLDTTRANGANPWTDDDPAFGFFDIATAENVNNRVQFDPHDGTGFPVSQYNPTNMMRLIHLGKACLDRSVDYTDHGGYKGNTRTAYPFVNLGVEVGLLDRVTGSYSQPVYAQLSTNREAAAMARFFAALALSESHVALWLAGVGLSTDPWGIEEMFYDLGDPLDEANRTLGSINLGTNTFTFRAPDFGTLGFITWFENGGVYINLGAPGGTYYAPTYGASGTAISVTNHPLGGTLRKFPTTYTNVDGFQPGQSPVVLRDNLFNNNAVVDASTLCGPLEAGFVRRIP